MLNKLYNKLLKLYGPQGWWPLLDVKGTNPTKTGSVKGYHPNNYDYPKTKLQQWEIIMGAMLTQNTSWPQVETALKNLKKINAFKPKDLISKDIKEAIKPVGYFNQKSERLKLLAKWFLELKQIPSRDELLKQKGIGPETADSILLYAFKQPEFVVDTYTKRILLNLKIINQNATYNDIKYLFESKIKKNYQIYQEFHALLVEHAKQV